MRQGFCAFLIVTLTPIAAHAGEFAVPSSGVLAPTSVASLYDSGTMTSGRPVGAQPVEIRSQISAHPAKSKVRTVTPTQTTRSSITPYVRHARRPAATLPPGIVAPPPYRPGMPAVPVASNDEPASYAAAPAPNSVSNGARGFLGAPAAPQAIRTQGQTSPAFSDLFSPGRSHGERGLFSSSVPSAPQAVRPAMPNVQASQIY
jgi:hypothetical protein